MSTLKSLTKVELIALIQARDAEIEKLRIAVAQATPADKPKRVSSTRFWDEFPTRSLGMQWARETGGVLKQRPEQRAVN